MTHARRPGPALHEPYPWSRCSCCRRLGATEELEGRDLADRIEQTGTGPVSCPHPEKVVYRSERAAKAAIRSIDRFNRAGVGFLHAYRCGAHWHVGHGHKSSHTKPGRKFKG